MKITIFTSNQPRHLALVNRLATISDTTYAVLESTTVFPGQVQDFYNKSEIFQKYFSNVLSAEKKIFGDLTFTSNNVKSLVLKSGDLNLLVRQQLIEALNSDVFVVFGSSFIKGWLVDFLIQKNAVNLHIGISPFYRGSSCNFWALYDSRPEFVGATVHLLSKGLDSGPILYHAIPKLNLENPFEFTMSSVDAVQKSLIERIVNDELKTLTPIEQNKKLQIRYSRDSDFTDEVAAEFLSRSLDNQGLKQILNKSTKPDLVRPITN